MLTLALDTSTSQGGAAVLDGTKVLSRRIWSRGKSHSELLTQTLEDCLQEAGYSLRDLQRLAVGRGPGSFTGIRIAINAVRTLSYSLSLPVFAFDTTEVLAAGVPVGTQPLVTLVNAHKNLLYTSHFEARSGAWCRTQGPDALTLDQVATLVGATDHLCVGDGFPEFERILPESLKSHLLRDLRLSDHPLPEALGIMPDTWPSRPLDWNEVQALYIRASEAEEKLRERLEPRS